MSLVRVNPDDVSTLLAQTAQSIVLPRFQALAHHEIIEKNPGDVVTVADIEAEAELERALSTLLPGSVVVGEEAHHRDPSILTRLDGDAPAWLIDPIDGTANFTEGKPLFCMMLVLALGGEAVMSWIHDPLSGRTASAEKGSGTWIDGARLAVPSAPALDGMIGQINLGYFPREERGRIQRLAEQSLKDLVSLRCAGHDFLGITEGRHHFSMYRRLWSWDHAPGTLILREAGGIVERVDGLAYRLADRVEGLLSAPDPDAWHAIRHLLTGT